MASFEQLYDEATMARAGGDIDLAITRLEEATQLRPGNADALFLLGVLYSHQRRFTEAEDHLNRALAVAPDNVEIRLAQARALAWQGRNVDARGAVSSVLRDHPQSLDAKILEARLAFYDGDLATAEAGFRNVLAGQHDAHDGLIGLGDVLRAAGREQEARALYTQASTTYPDSVEALDRLQRRPEEFLRWRLDTAISYSDFTRQSRSAWREAAIGLGYRFDTDTSIRIAVEPSRRFGLTDTYIEAAVDHRASQHLLGYVGAGGTPGADFRERWAVFGGVSAGMADAFAPFDDGLLLFDARHADYATGSVQTVRPGYRQQVYGGRLSITGQWVNVWDENGDYQPGWLGRGDAAVTDWLDLYFGAADAAETEGNVTVDTFSVFAGFGVPLGDRTRLRFDYLREDRENSYIRQVFGLGLTAWF